MVVGSQAGAWEPGNAGWLGSGVVLGWLGFCPSLRFGLVFFAEVGGDGVEAFEDVLADRRCGDFFFEDLGDFGDEDGDLTEGDDVG